MAHEQWKFERHHLPNLKRLDETISSLERLIWEEIYPIVSGSASEGEDVTRKTNDLIRIPGFNLSHAPMRDVLLAQRNKLATVCQVEPREPHDLSGKALEYQKGFEELGIE